MVWKVSRWSEKFLDSLKNDLYPFLSQKQFTHTFLVHKRFTHFFCCENDLRVFFVANMIYALRLESVCALKSADWKVLSFSASARGI